jgi:hypothetical protein
LKEFTATLTKWIVAFLVIFLLLMVLLFSFLYRQATAPQPVYLTYR